MANTKKFPNDELISISTTMTKEMIAKLSKVCGKKNIAVDEFIRESCSKFIHKKGEIPLIVEEGLLFPKHINLPSKMISDIYGLQIKLELSRAEIIRRACNYNLKNGGKK